MRDSDHEIVNEASSATALKEFPRQTQRGRTKAGPSGLPDLRVQRDQDS